MTNILVLVDIQNDFIQTDGKLTVNEPQLAQNVAKFLKQHKDFFNQVIITCDTHFSETYQNTAEGKQFPPHCIYQTKGWEYPEEIRKALPKNTITLYKSTTDVWEEKEQYPVLQQNFANANIYIAGVCTDICVEQAMCGFLHAGAKVTILEDLTKGLKEQTPQVIQRYAPFQKIHRLNALASKQLVRA